MSRYKRYEGYKDSGVEWIGEIPEHWGIIKLKFLSTIFKGKNPQELTDEWREEFLPYLSMEYLRNSGDTLTLYAYPEKNLVTVNNSDILILWDGSNAGEIVEGKNGILSSTMAKIVPNNIVTRYLYWFLKGIEKFFKDNTVGMGIPHVNGETLKNHLVLLPNLQDQNSIANFLDQKTAEIDGLIADKEKLIELLQEKRQAIITEAVTKGLNPNVRLKDSGIEWIGEIPEHWEVKRIKYLATVNPSKSEVRHLPPEQEVTFIPMEKIVATGKVDYSITNTVKNLIDGYTYFRDGDIIMAKVTPCFENGNIAIVNGLLNGIGFGTTELHVLRCNNKCYNKFLFYYLQSDVFKSKGISEMYGVAGLKRIPTDFVLNYKLGIPDYQEQKQITLYLDTIVDKINTLISDIQTQIDKLKEYRQSIISEAVTGKIKIYNS